MSEKRSNHSKEKYKLEQYLNAETKKTWRTRYLASSSRRFLHEPRAVQVRTSQIDYYLSSVVPSSNHVRRSDITASAVVNPTHKKLI